jgi:hypothetical protein
VSDDERIISLRVARAEDPDADADGAGSDWVERYAPSSEDDEDDSDSSEEDDSGSTIFFFLLSRIL